MDIQAILQAITQVGFPIVCCGAMMWYVKYSTDKSRDEITRLNDQHRQEMTDVTQAINNNTIALTRLCDIVTPKDGV
jgi:hypothetical protein